MGRLVIFGVGGFGRELLAPALNQLRREGQHGRWTDCVFCDDRESEPILEIEVISSSELRPDDRIIFAIGNSETRANVANRFPSQWESLFAETSKIGPDVSLGAGAVLCDYTVITASAVIGAQFQCNIFSYVAHDCVIGDFVTFAPRVCCNGNVFIEDYAYIGTGAVIRQGTQEKPLRIGKGAVVGMGAVVTKDVPAGATVVGNPARPLGS